MNIAFLCNSTGSKLWRVLPQAKHFTELGHECHVIEGRAVSDEYIKFLDEWAAIVVFQMVGAPDLAKRFRKMGKKIIFECDDLIEYTPPSHPMTKETLGPGLIVLHGQPEAASWHLVACTEEISYFGTQKLGNHETCRWSQKRWLSASVWIGHLTARFLPQLVQTGEYDCGEQTRWRNIGLGK